MLKIVSIMKKIAVILCGSGYRDGSEIRESVAVLWALSKHPVTVQCFAPNEPQHDVVNCLTGSTVDEKRMMLVEAARIARGQVAPLSEMDPKHFDAVVLPGGFGVAKNLCTFAFEGAKGSVHPKLKEILVAMHAARKPMGAVCIAPAVVALAFPGKQFELTVGAKSEASTEIEKLGHRHVPTPVNSCHVDSANKIVTTAAYMYDNAVLHELFQGIDALVTEVVRLA